MIRFFANWRAKRAYIWRSEVKARTNEINAYLSLLNRKQKLTLVEQLNKDADAIEQNIKTESAALETGYFECENGHKMSTQCDCALAGSVAIVHVNDCVFNRFNKGKCFQSGCNKPMKLVKLSEMTGQEKYELEKERKEAEQIVASKREQAKQETVNAEEGNF
jgi:hypothetical protein